MPLRDWLRPPRSVLTFYLAGAAAALAGLIWLSARQLHLDEDAEAARNEQRLKGAAERVAARVSSAIRDLQSIAHVSTLPEDAVVLITDGDGVRVERGTLPYLPMPPRDDTQTTQQFDDAEALEFGRADLVAAARAYAQVAAAADADAVRARALLGRARVLLNAGELAPALDATSQIIDDARLSSAIVDGRPAGLLARLARGRVWERRGDRARLVREAFEVRDQLAAGRWPIAGPVWHATWDRVVGWSQSAAATPDLDRDLARAAAAEQFWREHASQPAPAAAILADEGDAALLVMSPGPPARIVIVDAAWLAASWQPVASDASVDVALIDRDRNAVLGRPTPTAVTISASDTGLPWTVAVSDADPERWRSLAGSRRRMFILAVALVGVVVIGSGVLTFRGIRREMTIARLHADFVSAASHEFRTPLTSIRQLSHMLLGNRVESETRRTQYYEVLVRESERLHKLVERLLTFGRVDAGRVRFESLDARDLTAAVVAEFSASLGRDVVEIASSQDSCPVAADRELLSLALWNLVDNAVKYSPAGARVHVSVDRSSSEVRLAVRDEGPGIAAADRPRLFEQFVRGANAAATAPGSGLGLALVHRVVHAHAGRIELSSAPGAGSVFTIVLPLERTP
jgi:signal transduction histidine kinase